ncbi:MAG: C39 family peptidase [Candidatus Dormibacteria bacterium]
MPHSPAPILASRTCISRGWRLLSAVAAAGTLASLTFVSIPAHAASAASINVRPTVQQHALDCEAAALQIALAAIGINASQDSLIQSIGNDPSLPMMRGGHPVRWGNPYSSFVGDPNGTMMRSGYGVYYPPVAAAARAAGAIATGAAGWQPSQLYAAVASGEPVVVWVPHLLASPSFGAWTAWDGTSVWYSPQEHTQVLVGFDMGTGTVTLADPWDARLHTYAMSLFANRLAAYHGMAVVVAPPDGPSAVIASGGRQAIFWKGSDSNLWEAWQSGGSWTPAVLVTSAAPLASAPSAAITALGQQIVFWKGTDGILHEIWWDPGSGWNGPVPVDGAIPLASRPSVMVTDGNQVVFWESLAGQLQEAWWNSSSGWNGPLPVPGAGNMSSAPSAIAATVGSRTEQAVFWKGSDGTLTEAWWDPLSGWNGPVPVSSAVSMGSGPAAAVTPANQQIVFWEGSDRLLREEWWDASYGWSGQAAWSFASLSSAPAVDVTADGQQVLYWRGGDANTWTARWSHGWSSPVDLRLGPIA